MRIGVMADVHGNLPAFEAALRHLRGESVDLLVLAGDIVNGSPDSKPCWELAASLGAPILRGNHERYVGLYGRRGAPQEWSTERFGPVRWSAAQLSDAERQDLIDLPLTHAVPSCRDLLLVHSSLRSDSDAIAAYTPEAELEAMFPGSTHRLLVRGHNHAPAVRLWRERTIVTTGSVGLTLDGIPTAQYAVVTLRGTEWTIQHHSVEYDIDAALERFHVTGYLSSAGPMARLFYREVATASFHIVPFMRAYEKALEEGSVTLEAAVSRFLGD